MTWITPAALHASIEAAEAGPTTKDLAEAPVMQSWNIVTYPGERDVRLHGRVTGHPEIDDPMVTTSPVLAIHADDTDGTPDGLAWIRTASRWYRLDVASYHPTDDETAADVVIELSRIGAATQRGLKEALRKTRAEATG